MKNGVILLMVLLLTSCAVNHKVMLGDESVIVQEYPGKGNTYVHVHQNEQTALKAAKLVMRQKGGRLITLVHSGERNIVFHLDKKRYEFDPNRIYTDAGIKKTLTQFGPYSYDAHKEVKKLSDTIKALLPEGKVIAVHNNQTYSLKNYLPGHDMAHDIRAFYQNPRQYYRNFYLVTQLPDYLRLKTKGFNGVLQRPLATDDGSMSIFLKRSQYINVEAGYDQLFEQIRMIRNA